MCVCVGDEEHILSITHNHKFLNNYNPFNLMFVYINFRRSTQLTSEHIIFLVYL